MRSPERFAIARAIGSRPPSRSPQLKLPARTDRDPDTTLQVCEKWTLTFSRENSLFRRKNSLIGQKKFPVPLRREFGCKPLNSLAN
jgi:hypothetical protein